MPTPQARYHRRFWALFLASWAFLALVIRDHVRKIEGEIQREGLASTSFVAIRSVLLDCLDVETGLRGYLITGRKDYLQPYYEGLGRLGRNLEVARGLMERDPEEGAHVREAVRYSEALVGEFRNQVEMVESSGPEAARARFVATPTKSAMDEVRKHVFAIQAEEERRLARNLADLDGSVRTTIWMLDAFTVIVVVILIAMVSGLVNPPVRPGPTPEARPGGT